MLLLSGGSRASLTPRSQAARVPAGCSSKRVTALPVKGRPEKGAARRGESPSGPVLEEARERIREGDDVAPGADERGLSSRA
jgi:hypothetical protein